MLDAIVRIAYALPVLLVILAVACMMGCVPLLLLSAAEHMLT